MYLSQILVAAVYQALQNGLSRFEDETFNYQPNQKDGLPQKPEDEGEGMDKEEDDALVEEDDTEVEEEAGDSKFSGKSKVNLFYSLIIKLKFDTKMCKMCANCRLELHRLPREPQVRTECL